MTPLDTAFQNDFEFAIKNNLQNRKVASNKTSLQMPTFINEKASEKQQQQQGIEERDYQVPKVFFPLILASKYIGFCPVKIKRRSDNGGIYYEFKWLSVEFLLSLVCSVTSATILAVWILNAIFDIAWPIRLFKIRAKGDEWLNENLFKGSQLISVLNNLIRVSLPIGACISLILSWGDVHSLCDFLNDWPVFSRKYNAAFSSYHAVTFSLSRVSKFNCAFWITPVLILMVVMRPRNFINEEDVILAYLLSYSQMMLLLGTRALSYLKDFLLLETVKAAYSETLNGIKAEYGKCKKDISRDQVREWMELVNFIRKQASRLESHISFQNLWSVFEIFTNVLLILSMAVFLFMNNKLGGSLQGNFFPFSLVCTAFFICSLFWKTELAEQIADKEEEIAEELLEMETGDDDCETRLEMKLICDVIYNDPVKIQVGNMLTLNKRLLLSFFSQLASYLVVILQFTKA